MATRKEGYIYARSYKELQDRHYFLFTNKPTYLNTYALVPHVNKYISAHTIRFPIFYEAIQKDLLFYFDRFIFSEMENEKKTILEVQIGFNAVLFKEDSNEYSLFFGLDFARKEKSFMEINDRVSYTQETYKVYTRNDVFLLPVSFENDLDEIISLLSLYFESSGVRVVDIINVVYLIKQIIN